MTFKKKAIPQATRRAVAERYGCKPGGQIDGVPCYWCGTEGSIYWHRLYGGKPSGWVSFSHELDHITPESRGGSMDPENFVLACKSCNCSKGNRAMAHEKGVSDSGAAVEDVRKNMSGKGREGKGIGREGKSTQFPFPSLVSYPASPEQWGWVKC